MPVALTYPFGTSHQTSSVKILNRNNYYMILPGTHGAKWQIVTRKNRMEIITVSQSPWSWTCWCQLAPDHEYKLEHTPSTWMRGNQGPHQQRMSLLLYAQNFFNDDCSRTLALLKKKINMKTVFIKFSILPHLRFGLYMHEFRILVHSAYSCIIICWHAPQQTVQ